MYHGLYYIHRCEMYQKNSPEAMKGEKKVYYSKVLALYVKLCDITKANNLHNKETYLISQETR